MTGIVVRRILIGLFVIWGAVSLMFVIVRLAPGDPATLLLGPDASTADIRQMRSRMGLDDPVLTQYATYLWHALSLDFGTSYRLDEPAVDAVLGSLPNTLELTSSASVIAVVIGLPLGVLAARRPGGLVDRLVSGFTLLLQSLPTFWVGIMLVLLFAVTLGLLPTSGAGSPRYLVLPAVTLALPFTAMVGRLTRAGVVEAMSEPYIRTARSKGLTEGQVLFGHALKNSLIPVITVVGLQMGTLLGGAVIVENVFAWPGLGTMVVESVAGRDYAVVQAAALFIAAIVVALNLTADLLYSRLDARIRIEVRR
ncbi:ABC transporter permease [Streptomyces sp. NPDC001508]|uniref:ABC transporter permease n=1 Tax=Streptomyces sp. NPDC001508 TaxID=3154656 RepID=UPI0033241D50